MKKLLGVLLAGMIALTLSACGTTEKSDSHTKSTVKPTVQAKEKSNYPSSDLIFNTLRTAYIQGDYKTLYENLDDSITKQTTLDEFLQSKPNGVSVKDISRDGKESVISNNSITVLKIPVIMTIVQNGNTQTAKTNWVFLLEDGKWKFVGSDK